MAENSEEEKKSKRAVINVFWPKNPTYSPRSTPEPSLYLILGGKNLHFFTPPPHMFHHDISAGPILLIDLEWFF